jgi:hypothetical protein
VEEGLRVADVTTMRARFFDTACVLLTTAVFATACTRHAEPAPGDASVNATASGASAERATLECLSIEPPDGATKAGGVGGGLAFHGSRKLRSGTVSYEPAFTVSTQAADGSDSSAIRDELMKAFTAQYEQAKESAAGSDGLRVSDLQPPRSTPQPVAGTRGHAWQIDTIATFNGERLPWRAFSMTTVYKNRVYVVTAAAALPNVGELRPLADRYFASMRFDGCK